MRVFLFLLLCCQMSEGRAEEPVRPVLVRMDCREGVGLIPGLWRGIAGSDGRIPEGLSPGTVRLSPELVRAAWKGKLDGGDYAWAALDAALDSLKARGARAVLSLPVPPGNALVDVWPELVYDAAHRTADRVWRFEVWSGPEAPAGGMEHYLRFYESAVWAIYRADRKAAMGGPGAGWQSGGPEALLKRCVEMSLPLHFLSWRVPVGRPQDLAHSVQAAEGLLSRFAPEPRPGLLISGWHTVPDSGAGSAALALSALREVLYRDVEAVCLEVADGGDGLLALRAFERLGRVQVGMAVAPDGPGVEGIASLDGEDVVALFWRLQGEAPVPVRASFTGLAWGKRVRVRRYRLDRDAPVEEQVLPMQEPVEVSFPLATGYLTAIHLSVED